MLVWHIFKKINRGVRYWSPAFGRCAFIDLRGNYSMGIKQWVRRNENVSKFDKTFHSNQHSPCAVKYANLAFSVQISGECEASFRAYDFIPYRSSSSAKKHTWSRFTKVWRNIENISMDETSHLLRKHEIIFANSLYPWGSRDCPDCPSEGRRENRQSKAKTRQCLVCSLVGGHPCAARRGQDKA